MVLLAHGHVCPKRCFIVQTEGHKIKNHSGQENLQLSQTPYDLRPPEVRRGPQTLLSLGPLSGSLFPLGGQDNTFFPSTVLHCLCSDRQLLKGSRSFPGPEHLHGPRTSGCPEWVEMECHA